MKTNYNNQDLLSFIHFLVLGLEPYDKDESLFLDIRDNSIYLEVFIHNSLFVSYLIEIVDIKSILKKYGVDTYIYMDDRYDNDVELAYNGSLIILILDLLHQLDILFIEVVKAN